MMFENNKDFYEDVVSKKFDIKLLEHSFKKRKWCPKQVVAFLAFGYCGKTGVLELLNEWCLNWKVQFWWYVFYVKFNGVENFSTPL